MLFCDILSVKRVIFMLYDGNKFDTTDKKSDRFLEINSCGLQNVKSGYTVVRKNGRKDYHILLILNGKCSVLHNGRTYGLDSGNFVIYAPNEEQKYTFTAEGTSLWCHFGGSAVAEILDECAIGSGIYFCAESENVSAAFTDMIRNFHLPCKTRLANADLLSLLYHISDTIANPGESDCRNAIIPVLTYISVNYSKKLSLDFLAEMSGYSKSRFSHIFSKAVKTSPIKYQNEIRLKTAYEMLLSTGLPVSEIALSCGFNDVFYFSRLFKKKYGIPPSALRTKPCE